MELTITEPVFAWIFGILGAFLALGLIVFVIALIELTRLLKLVHEKAVAVGETVDEVRGSVHRIVESMDNTREKVASFVAAATSAASIAKIVETVRDVWSTSSKKSKNKRQK